MYCNWLLTFLFKIIGCDQMFMRQEEVNKGEIHFSFSFLYNLILLKKLINFFFIFVFFI